MGVTIHYNGKLEDRARLAELLDAARLYCAEQRWLYHEIDERIIGKVERLISSNAKSDVIEDVEVMFIERNAATTEWSPIDDTLRGLIINPHPESEPITLTFNEAGALIYYMPLNDIGEYWEMSSQFTKTQFAGTETHIAVCDFLHWLQDNYLPNLHVNDEGNYFETREAKQLARSFDTITAAMDQLQAALDNLDADDPKADYFRQILDSLAEDKEKQDAPRKKKKLVIERGKKIAHPNPQWKRGHGSSAGKN